MLRPNSAQLPALEHNAKPIWAPHTRQLDCVAPAEHRDSTGGAARGEELLEVVFAVRQPVLAHQVLPGPLATTTRRKRLRNTQPIHCTELLVEMIIGRRWEPHEGTGGTFRQPQQTKQCG